MYTTTICAYIYTLCMSHIEYNILNLTRNTYPKAYIVFLRSLKYRYNNISSLHGRTLLPDPAKHTLALLRHIKIPYRYMNITHATH